MASVYGQVETAAEEDLVTIDEQLRAGVLDTELTRRALQVALDKTTDMADDVLRVPLHYYRDPKITEIEEAQILRRTPLAVLPSVQVAGPNDYVVRSVLGDSLLSRAIRMERATCS